MAADAGAIARLSRLLVDGALDARALDAREGEIAALLGRAQSGPALSRSDLLVLGVNLHAYYTVLETLLERIARLVDEDVPSGAAWHRDLLSQMRIELPGLRPRVIPSELLGELDELRKFQTLLPQSVRARPGSGQDTGAHSALQYPARLRLGRPAEGSAIVSIAGEGVFETSRAACSSAPPSRYARASARDCPRETAD